jgi:hypothetical protein
LPWTQTSERISRNFWRIWTRKTSVNTFRSFWSRVKSEYWEVKKSHKGEEENFFKHTSSFKCNEFSFVTLSFFLRALQIYKSTLNYYLGNR